MAKMLKIEYFYTNFKIKSLNSMDLKKFNFLLNGKNFKDTNFFWNGKTKLQIWEYQCKFCKFSLKLLCNKIVQFLFFLSLQKTFNNLNITRENFAYGKYNMGRCEISKNIKIPKTVIYNEGSLRLRRKETCR